MIRKKIRHDGGSHNVEIEIDHGQAVVRFGASFTLRVDEKNTLELCDALEQALQELRDCRRSEAQTVDVFDVAESDFIERGIEGREKKKASSRDQKEKQCAEDFAPNDPVNW